jgi:hypothetical protein
MDDGKSLRNLFRYQVFRECNLNVLLQTPKTLTYILDTWMSYLYILILFKILTIHNTYLGSFAIISRIAEHNCIFLFMVLI